MSDSEVRAEKSGGILNQALLSRWLLDGVW